MRYHVVPSSGISDVANNSSANCVALHVIRENIKQLFDLEELNDNITDALESIGVASHVIPEDRFYGLQSAACYNDRDYLEYRFHLRSYDGVDPVVYVLEGITADGRHQPLKTGELVKL